MDLSDSALLTEEGYFVSEKWVRLNELLTAFDPDLELHWIPTDKRSTDDKYSYRIIHRPPPTSRMAPYVVMYASETDSPEEVFARIIGGDSWRHDVNARLESRNKAHEIFMRKKHLDELAESADLVHFLLKRAPNYTTIHDRNGSLIKLDANRFRMDTPVARRRRR